MAETHHEEEVLGKAYDARLMRRLLAYLRPYKWQTAIALGSIVIKACADVLGPVLTMVAIDRYLSGHVDARGPYRFAYSFFASRLSLDPYIGIAQVAEIYLGLLAL